MCFGGDRGRVVSKGKKGSRKKKFFTFKKKKRLLGLMVSLYYELHGPSNCFVPMEFGS